MEKCEHASYSPATAVGFALRACPFLKAVAAKEGDDFAARFSVAPLVPAAAGSAGARPPPPLEEQAAFAGFASSYSFFHGEGGVLPLAKAKAKATTMTNAAASSASAAASRCPFHTSSQAAASSELARSVFESKGTVVLQAPARSGASKVEQAGQETRISREQQSVEAASPWSSSSPTLPATSAPFASISLRLFGGEMPDGGEWVRRLRRHQQQKQKSKNSQQKKQKRPQPPSSSSSSTPQPPSSSSGGAGGSARGPAPPRVASRAPPSSSSSLRPPLPSRNRKNNNKIGKHPSGDAPRCPLRDWPVLGALLPLAAGGETLGLNCPQAIVALRAAVARVPQVRSLRPRPLWLKGAAVVAAGAAANAPFGAWRAHTKKFSLEWFVAVHATVPFVAALRQATLLPRWALVLTVAGAVAGQMVGARIEEARLRAVEERRKEKEREEEGAVAKALHRRPRQKSSILASAAPERRFALPPFLLLRSGGGSAAGSAPHLQQRGSSVVVV